MNDRQVQTHLKIETLQNFELYERRGRLVLVVAVECSLATHVMPRKDEPQKQQKRVSSQLSIARVV